MIKTLVLTLCVLGLAAAATPKFPTDWEAIITQSIAINQGGEVQPDGSICCAPGSNCKIQRAFQGGKQYFSYTTKQTRFDAAGGQGIIITDFNIGKEMAIKVVNDTLTCNEWCPVDKADIAPGFLGPNATDIGPVTIDGKQYEQWQWNETILGVVVMEISTLYVDQSDVNNAIPYMELDQLTPFGEHIGNETANYLSFKGGKQDPSLFKVAGIDSCQEGGQQDCGDDDSLASYLARGMYNTYLMYASNNAKPLAGYN